MVNHGRWYGGACGVLNAGLFAALDVGLIGRALASLARGAPDWDKKESARAKPIDGDLFLKAGDFGGVAIVVDGCGVGNTGSTRNTHLDPAPHLVLIDGGDRAAPVTQRFEVTAGASLTVVVPSAARGTPRATRPLAVGAATAKAPAIANTSPSASAHSVAAQAPEGAGLAALRPGASCRNAGIVTAGANAVVLAGVLLFALPARSASADVSRQYDAERDNASRRSGTLHWVGYGSGAATVATGVWLFAHGAGLDKKEVPRTSPALNVSLWPRSLAIEGVP